MKRLISIVLLLFSWNVSLYAAPTSVTASWESYVSNTVAPVDQHEISVYCSTGVPTDADLVGTTIATDVELKFLLGEPGETVSCYLKTLRKDHPVTGAAVWSLAGPTVSEPIPYPDPNAPAGTKVIVTIIIQIQQ